MPNTLRLLRQIRQTTAALGMSASSLREGPGPSALEVALNTLQLQQSPEFYLEHIAEGCALLVEGAKLAGAAPAPLPESHAAQRPELLEAHIGDIRRAMVQLVDGLDERRSAEEKRFLVRMSDWETRFYTHHLEQAADAGGEGGGFTQTAVEAYLREKLPDRSAVKITNFRPLEGGFSKKTVLFETHDPVGGHEALVIRAEQAFDLLRYPGSDVTREFFMIELMRKSGMPIAEPLWLEADANRLGSRFIVSRKADGKVYGGALGSEESLSPALLESVISTFIQMHNVKVEPDDPLAVKSHLAEWLPFSASLRETTRFYVSEWLPRLIERMRLPSSPQICRALKWLQHNIPESDESPVVLHGDYSFNNLIIGPSGISAVLDWESSRLGDPAEDIIWTQPNIGSYIDMAAFLDRYQRGTGRRISQRRLAYARVVKCVLNSLACLSAYDGLENRADTSINLSILAYKYMGLFGAQFNSLIDSAERL